MKFNVSVTKKIIAQGCQEADNCPVAIATNLALSKKGISAMVMVDADTIDFMSIRKTGKIGSKVLGKVKSPASVATFVNTYDYYGTQHVSPFKFTIDLDDELGLKIIDATKPRAEK